MSAEPRLIELPRIVDSRGNLTVIENGGYLPFEIRRVFWIFGVPGGCSRGGHAYRTQEELVVALSGSFDIVVQSEEGEARIQLNRSYTALHLPALTWRRMENFSTNALSLHLSSSMYLKEDYIRDFDGLLELRRNAR